MSLNPEASREDRGRRNGRPTRGARPSRSWRGNSAVEGLEGRQLLAVAPAIGSFFPIPTAESNPKGIALGPDGNLWFTESEADQIGRSTPGGGITEFAVPTVGGEPREIVSGPGGDLWFTEQGGNKIGRIDTAGNITEYTLPTSGSAPAGITVGPDGNIWFTELTGDKIGRITPQGVVTEFALPTADAEPLNITSGPDGALYFTENLANQIGRITPSNGAIVEYPLSAAIGPQAITTGPDGALWFTEDGPAIGRITTSGVQSSFTVPSGSNSDGIAAGPNGALYFAEVDGAIGEITTDGTVSETAIGGASHPVGLAFGPNNYLYITDTGLNTIDVADLQIPTVSGFQVVQSRGGLAQIVIQFGGPITVQSAQDIANYTLSTPGNRSGTFDTADRIFAGKATDRYLHLKSAVYNSSNNSVILTTSRPLSRTGNYRLRLSGEYPFGIAGPSGNTLQGNGASTPGNYLDLYFRGYTKVASTPSAGLSTLGGAKVGKHHRG